jgi:hypothetical protein
MAEENSTIIVNNTTYSIQEKWLETAKVFFGVDENDEAQVSLLKAGLFGYNNEIMSNEIKNNVYHRNTLYDEHFLNTASMPSSIYNHAKTQNVQVENAVPSHLRINFSVKKNDIINSSKFTKISGSEGLADSDSAYEFIIGTDYTFTVGEYVFTLPYPVQLTFTRDNNTNEYSVVGRYMQNESDFPYATFTSPYIKLWEQSYSGVKYLYLGLDIYQMEKLETDIKVVSEDISDNLYYTISFDDQIAFFDVYYSYNGERTKLETFFNNTYTPEDGVEYCYYNFIDDNKLEISFSSLPNSFRPKYNSTLEVEIFLTKGSEGNFSYNGNILMNYIEDTEMSKIPVYIIPMSDVNGNIGSSGGKDKPTYLEMKNKLVENYLVRDNLITDYDLDMYFNQLSSQNTINGSSVKFIKKRNDPIKRMWNAYLLLRNSSGAVLPTSTLPSLFISRQEIEENNYTIPENAAVVYNKESGTYSLVWHILEVEEYIKSDKYLVYSIPYLMKIEQQPILSSTYYKTHIAKDVSLSFNYINPSIPYQFLISSFSVERNNMDSETYIFKLSLNTNLTDVNIDDNVRIRAVMRSKTGEVYGYFEFQRVSDTELLYEGYISTEKWNTINNGKMNIYNSLFSLDSSSIVDNDGMTSVKNIAISPEVNIDLMVMYKSDFSKDKTTDALKMPDMTDYATACLFSSDDSISLFSNMSNVIESSIFPSDDGFTVKSIPLVEYKFFRYNYPLVYSILDGFTDTLSDNLDKLENLTTIDVKLYNTYGKSFSYYSNKTYNETSRTYDYKLIDRVDLNLDLTIHSNGAVTTEMDNAVKKYVSDFIEDCNDEGIFPISNLMRQLENNFEFIRFIEFGNINGLPVQKIESRYTSFLEMEKQEVMDYVPEYLNLRKELKTSENSDVTTLHYNYAITINYI